MPTGPKGEKRPADVIGNAVHVMRVAIGEIEDVRPTPESEGKNPAAVALGRMGGKARAEGLSAPTAASGILVQPFRAATEFEVDRARKRAASCNRAQTSDTEQILEICGCHPDTTPLT